MAKSVQLSQVAIYQDAQAAFVDCVEARVWHCVLPDVEDTHQGKGLGYRLRSLLPVYPHNQNHSIHSRGIEITLYILTWSQCEKYEYARCASSHMVNVRPFSSIVSQLTSIDTISLLCLWLVLTPLLIINKTACTVNQQS